MGSYILRLNVFVVEKFMLFVYSVIMWYGRLSFCRIVFVWLIILLSVVYDVFGVMICIILILLNWC